MERPTKTEFLQCLDSRAPVELYNALLAIVRANAQGHPYGHDHIIRARWALAYASGRSRKTIDWAKERPIR